MPGQPIGKFEVLKQLGTGAHSTICHVRCARDGKQYALKIVTINSADDRKFHDQAKLEFRVGQMLDHPNLIKVYSLEEIKDWFFRIKKVHLLIEYVNGKTLDQIQGLKIPHLVQVFAKIAAGMAHMHRRGVFHADLKPNNIMLSKTGDVKIIDYGLAWIKGEPKDRVQGTPEYMAPEQAKRSTANESTDIYNFGATMYRLVTWRLPPSSVPSPGQPAMSSKIFQGLVKPVRELNPKAPTELADLIHSCLSYDARSRPERVNDILEVLNPLVKRLVRTPEDELETNEW